MKNNKETRDLLEVIALKNMNKIRNQIMDILYPLDERLLSAIIVLLHDELKEEITDQEYEQAV